MSLELLLESIRAAAEAEAEDVEQSARQKAEAILEEAEFEAASRRKQVAERAEQRAQRERSRILHQARTEAMKVVGQARSEIVEAVLAELEAALAGVRDDQRYSVRLQAWIEDALNALSSSGEIRLRADKRDQDLVRRALEATGTEVEVAWDLETWGGVIAHSTDGQIEVTNTLEIRFERAQPELRQRIRRWLGAE